MVAYFCHHLSDNYVDSPDLYVDQRRIQHRRTGRAPRVWKFLRVFFYFESIIRINFIVINMQCLLYAFNYLLLLQKHKVCVKGHQNNLQNPKTIPRLDRAPRFLNSWIRYCWPSSYLCRLARSLYRLVRKIYSQLVAKYLVNIIIYCQHNYLKKWWQKYASIKPHKIIRDILIHVFSM